MPANKIMHRIYRHTFGPDGHNRWHGHLYERVIPATMQRPNPRSCPHRGHMMTASLAWPAPTAHNNTAPPVRAGHAREQDHAPYLPAYIWAGCRNRWHGHLYERAMPATYRNAATLHCQPPTTNHQHDWRSYLYIKLSFTH